MHSALIACHFMATYFISFNPHMHGNSLCILLQQDLHLIMQQNIGSTMISAEQSYNGWSLRGDISRDNNDHFHILINLSMLCHSLMWILICVNHCRVFWSGWLVMFFCSLYLSGRRCHSTMWRQDCCIRGTIWVAHCPNTAIVNSSPASPWRN